MGKVDAWKGRGPDDPAAGEWMLGPGDRYRPKVCKKCYSEVEDKAKHGKPAWGELQGGGYFKIHKRRRLLKQRCPERMSPRHHRVILARRNVRKMMIARRRLMERRRRFS